MNVNGAVYIHTRNRLNFLSKSLPKWLEQTPTDIPIHLVVEPHEVKMHQRFLDNLDVQDIAPSRRVNVIGIKGKNKGMGNSRNVAFLDAKEHGYTTLITSDDDCYPRVDPTPMLAAARDPEMRDVFGVGCYFGIYSLMNKMDQRTGVHQFTGGGGFRTFAMNVAKLDHIGGFPVAFRGQDDNEVCRMGIAEGWRWMVHTDVPFVSIAKIGDPGGMCELPGMADGEQRKHEAHVKSFANWPDFISDPAKCKQPHGGKCSYKTMWKKMMRHYGVLD